MVMNETLEVTQLDYINIRMTGVFIYVDILISYLSNDSIDQ